jgi:molybdopterin converting factor subunit 1
MKLHVRLFAAARQLAQCESLEVECPGGTTVADLRGLLSAECPALVPLLAHVRFAVNATYAAEHHVIGPADDVACIPPVSGG